VEVTAATGGMFSVLADLVLPSRCAGCDMAPGSAGVCETCAAALTALVPYETVPTPCPAGLPPCVTLGAYEGPLRRLVLAYKDGGRHRLARPLAGPLARGVATCARLLGRDHGAPIVLVPVPSSAAAARGRNGDHMRRLGRRVVGSLDRSGWPAALARPVTARPRPDSAHLSALDRAALATDAFQIRSSTADRVAVAAAAGACVIVIDDVLTTGATLASLTTRLASAGVAVQGAVTLAATVRRITPASPAVPS